MRNIGKFIFQNEIVGDFGKEFGLIFEKFEDILFDEFGVVLQVIFDGNFGKIIQGFIVCLIFLKMFGGFNIMIVRKYFEMRWGLGFGC